MELFINYNCSFQYIAFFYGKINIEIKYYIKKAGKRTSGLNLLNLDYHASGFCPSRRLTLSRSLSMANGLRM